MQIRWKPFGPYITATLAILASLYYNHTKDVALEKYRAVAEVALVNQDHAMVIADQMTADAAQATARADSIEHARAITAPAVAKIVAAAPDTCKKVIAALQGQLAQAQAEAQGRKVAYQDQKEATAVLKPAATDLADATKGLIKASHHSMLIPHFGVGVTAGFSAIDRRPDVVVGVTMSWHK